jgi:hypothetical protein
MHIQKYLADIESGGRRYIDLFKKDWKEASKAERGKFLSGSYNYRKGKYSVFIDEGFTPMKRTRNSYNRDDVTVNGESYNP